MHVIHYLKIADCFTLGNLFAGVLAVYFAIHDQLLLSAGLLFLAAAFDVLDGKVAGWMHEKNLFGKEIDSLSDLVSFGVAPVLVYFVLDSAGLFKVMAGLFFVACGMLRLARYNVTEISGFEGMPISVNGIVFAILMLLHPLAPESLEFWPPVFVLQGLLMIASFKIPRIF